MRSTLNTHFLDKALIAIAIIYRGIHFTKMTKGITDYKIPGDRFLFDLLIMGNHPNSDIAHLLSLKHHSQ
ncbi:MAG: hypothetical protein AB4426_21940 [Xenococcaceae cyanobacterium]